MDLHHVTAFSESVLCLFVRVKLTGKVKSQWPSTLLCDNVSSPLSTHEIRELKLIKIGRENRGETYEMLITKTSASVCWRGILPQPSSSLLCLDAC